MKVKRYDRQNIKAQRTDNGHIYDTPVITRTGVFPYYDPDGTVRHELRLPEEVFNQDSLNTLRGIPVTNGHVGVAGANNTHGNIGTVLSIGRQDGDNLIADIVIHNPATIDAGNKELSCGYECDLEEKSGVWNGQEYDYIQRNIRHNHLAVVSVGRAGNARMNLDAADFINPKNPEKSNKEGNMPKVRLNSGIDYDAVPEVAAAYETLKAELAEAQKAKATLEAERDAAKADLQKMEAEKAEIQENARKEAMERVKLEDTAKGLGVEVKADAANKDIKAAVVKKIRQDSMDLSGKSEDYINAAYDLAIADNTKAKQAQAAAGQRQDMADKGDANNNTGGSAADARAKMINGGK